MKSLIDIGVALVFFGAYLAADIYVATLALIIALYAALLLHRLIWKQWNKGHLVGAIAASVLGGATLLVHDPEFIMLKPTAVYGVFALALAASTLIGRTPLLQRIPQQTIRLPERTWRRLTWAWAGFFAFCAVLNLVLARSLTEADWVTFKTFGFTALMFLFLIAHLPFIGGHLNDTAPDAERSEDDHAVHDSRP